VATADGGKRNGIGVRAGQGDGGGNASSGRVRDAGAFVRTTETGTGRDRLGWWIGPGRGSLRSKVNNF
jgi:hypothetical protein